MLLLAASLFALPTAAWAGPAEARLALDKLSASPMIDGAALVGADGLMLLHTLPASADHDSVAALSTAVSGISERTLRTLGGTWSYTVVGTANGPGSMLVVDAGDSVLLVALLSPKTDVFKALTTVRAAAPTVTKALAQ